MKKFTKEQIEDAVKQSVSMAGVLRILGVKQSGGSHAHFKRVIIKHEIDCSHFTGQAHARGSISKKRLSASDILCYSESIYRTKTKKLLRALLEIGREYKCEECGIGSTYNNKPITLEIDHKDGNYQNNVAENLRFMCPNCHSQTANFGNKS